MFLIQAGLVHFLCYVLRWIVGRLFSYWYGQVKTTSSQVRAMGFPLPFPTANFLVFRTQFQWSSGHPRLVDFHVYDLNQFHWKLEGQDGCGSKSKLLEIAHDELGNTSKFVTTPESWSQNHLLNCEIDWDSLLISTGPAPSFVHLTIPCTVEHRVAPPNRRKLLVEEARHLRVAELCCCRDCGYSTWHFKNGKLNK